MANYEKNDHELMPKNSGVTMGWAKSRGFWVPVKFF